MKGKNWSTINTIVEIVAGIAGLTAIFTGIKAADYDRKQLTLEMGETFGLTPIEAEEDE